MPLASSKSLDGQDENTADKPRLVHIVKVFPGYLLLLALRHLGQNGICKRRRPSATNHIIKVERDLRDRHALLLRDFV